MSNRLFGYGLAATAGAALVLGMAALPAAAAPIGAVLPALATAVDESGVTLVASKRKRAHRRAYRHAPVTGYAPGYDNVGSVVYDGYGHGYNRVSGQRYHSCVFDEGYGRVKPCDSGGAPN